MLISATYEAYRQARLMGQAPDSTRAFDPIPRREADNQSPTSTAKASVNSSSTCHPALYFILGLRNIFLTFLFSAPSIVARILTDSFYVHELIAISVLVNTTGV